MRAPIWSVRLVDRFAEWLLTWTRRPECPHCGNAANVSIEVERATEDDPIPVRLWVCAECAHKPWGAE